MTRPATGSLPSRLAGVIVALCLAVAVAACSSSNPLSSGGGSANDYAGAGAGTKNEPPGVVKPVSSESSAQVNRIFNEYSVPQGDASAAEYKIAPMDVVEVSVYAAPDLSRTAQVSASGNITLPLIRDVKAAGKTTDQLQHDIAAKLQKDFMQSPQVFVAVKEYNSQRVTVDGAVKNPGVFPLKGETTLVQVIALAGGLNEMGSPSGIYVLRKVKGKKMAARFDLKEIRSGKVDDPVMLAGDIVMVDESGGMVALNGLKTAMGFTGLFSLLAF